MTKSTVQSKIAVNTSIKEPSLYRVIYINDEVTTMSFVVESLVNHFDYTQDTAITITENIHEKGSAVVAILPFEIAEQKRHEVVHDARAAKYPLRVTIESDEA